MGVVKLSTAGIVNYDKYSNLRAGIPLPSPASFDLLETQVLASSESSVTFSSLSTYAADYQHLQIRGTVRDTHSSGSARLGIRFNNDTGSNYAYHGLFARGSSVSSYAGSSIPRGWVLVDTPYLNSDANSFAGFVLDLLDPFETTKNTTTRSFGGYAPSGGSVTQSVVLGSSLWNNTASVTDITLLSEQGTALAIGSRFSLYGIRGG